MKKIEMIKNIMNIINNFTTIKSIRHFAQNICLFLILGLATLTNAQTNSHLWTVSQDSSWEDLKLFLPKAKMAGTSVWVSLLPPSKTPPINPSGNYSEPFRLDFITWAEEIAKLSLRYSNLKGYGIENLQENLNLEYLTQNFVNNIKAAGTAINPKLQFISIEPPPSYNLWYVDRDATGNGDATSWANASVHPYYLPWASIEAGDTIYVSGGSDSTNYISNATTFLIYNKDFPSEVVITNAWEADHNGEAIFTHTQSGELSFEINNCENLKLTGLTFATEQTAEDGVCTVKFKNGINNTIDNCHIISNGTGFGLILDNETKCTITNNYIETLENVIDGYGEDPIWIGNGDGGHIITGNILNNRGTWYTVGHTDIIQMENEGSPYNYETVIANNIMIALNTASSATQGFLSEDMQSNRFLVYNNLILLDSYNSGAFSISGIDTCRISARIFNNTILTGGTGGIYGILLTGGVDTAVIKNNIIAMDSAGIDDNHSFIYTLEDTTTMYKDIDYNHYYIQGGIGVRLGHIPTQAGFTFAEWQAKGYDTHSDTGAVGFAYKWDTTALAYKLVTRGAGIDEGIDLSAYFTTDILGTTRPQNGVWDVGAVEGQ